MTKLSRRNFLKTLGGVVVVGSLAACNGGGSGDGSDTTDTTGTTGAFATPEEAEAAKAEIRRAIGLLFDRTYICEQIAQADQIPASTFVCQGVGEPDGSDFMHNAGRGNGTGYYDAGQEALAANFEAAVDVLKKYYTYDEGSGMFTDFPTMTYLYNTSESHKAIGEYLQSALAGVGITMNMENQEWATFLNTRKDGNYSIARNGWIMDYTDPICMLDMWTSGSGNNDVQYGKGAHADLAMYNLDLTPWGYDTKVENGTWAETFDVLIDTINKCSDQPKRFEMMHLAEDILMDTGCLCPLYYYTNPYLLNKDVEGFYVTPLGFAHFEKTTVAGAGDSINVTYGSEPDTLDPALNSAVDGATTLVHTFAGLSKWDLQPDGTYAIAPECAQEMVEGVENEDGTVTYTYTLRDGLTWSDGQPLTAHDFEFAWKRAASDELGADYGEMYSVIVGYPNDLAVTATDDKTLEVTTTNLIAYWDELMAFPVFYPVREDVVSNESWATDPATYVCNGPYSISKWDHNSVITLTKRDDYWDAANISMSEINWYLSDDHNTNLANWENGDWHYIDEIPTNEMARVKEQYADQYVVAPYAGTYYVCWNVNTEILPA
ncbi:hypothetical protein EII22_04570 [Coriobacteriales bacterium OH1046]|nr:hypothetical protein EII22_04570 [Coriobacteriales bacterium OH1046]